MLMRIKKLKKSKKGFTLIELIVVIAILGILAAIAVPRLTGFQETARYKSDQVTAKIIATTCSALLASDKFAGQTSGTTAGTVAISGVANTTTEIQASFPNSTIPSTVSTTAGAVETYTYTVDIATGDVKVISTTTKKQLYPQL